MSNDLDKLGHYVASFEDNMNLAKSPATPKSDNLYRPTITGWIGIALVLFWVSVSLTGPFLAPHGENELPFPEAYSEFQAPQPGALLGTDVLDRDVLSRLLYGASRTIGISFAATFLAYFVGVFAGLGAAISSPKTNMIVSRINDAFLSLPTIMLGLVVVAAVGSSIPVLIVTAGLIYASVVFRLARAIGMEIVVMDYVESARARGEGKLWIITREIWPNARTPLITDFGLRMIYIILFISSLSFLGLGVQPPQADWGSMVRENLGAVHFGATVISVLAPALAIASLTIGINLIVDDLSTKDSGQLTKKM